MKFQNTECLTAYAHFNRKMNGSHDLSPDNGFGYTFISYPNLYLSWLLIPDEIHLIFEWGLRGEKPNLSFMLSAKQESAWYHLYNVFGTTWGDSLPMSHDCVDIDSKINVFCRTAPARNKVQVVVMNYPGNMNWFHLQSVLWEKFQFFNVWHHLTHFRFVKEYI